MGSTRGREDPYKLVPGQSRLRGRSRRHPSLATDALAVARAVWTPCLPRPRPANYVLAEEGASSNGWLFSPFVRGYLRGIGVR